MNTTSKVALTTANWILKDTDRSNLNSKVKYPSFALSLNILFLLLVFIGFNTFKVRFDIAYKLVTITIVQAMVNVGLLFPWSCMCLVEDMINSLDDCDLLEEVVIMTNILEHNDLTVSINVQHSSDVVMQNMYIIIVLVFCVNAMAINVIANQAEYQ